MPDYHFKDAEVPLKKRVKMASNTEEEVEKSNNAA